MKQFIFQNWRAFVFGSGALLLPTIARAQATCTLNGQEVPCNQVQGFAALGIGLMILLFAVGLALFVFWILMIVHAATHAIENKAVWVIVIVIFQGIGAIIYYFAVKRKFDKAQAMPPPAYPPTPSSAAPPAVPPAQEPPPSPPSQI